VPLWLAEEEVESNREADEKALVERAEEVVNGIENQLGYPNLRPYGPRVVDDFVKPAWAGMLLGGLEDVDMDVLKDVDGDMGV